MQAVDITVQEAVQDAVGFSVNVKSLRTETMFNCFHDQTLKGSQPLTEESILPRHRKLPKCLDSGSSTHQY